MTGSWVLLIFRPQQGSRVTVRSRSSSSTALRIANQWSRLWPRDHPNEKKLTLQIYKKRPQKLRNSGQLQKKITHRKLLILLWTFRFEKSNFKNKLDNFPPKKVQPQGSNVFWDSQDPDKGMPLWQQPDPPNNQLFGPLARVTIR